VDTGPAANMVQIFESTLVVRHRLILPKSWSRFLMPAPFDQIEIGQVVSLGTIAVEPKALDAFLAAFAPDRHADQGAPDAFTFALWTRLDNQATLDWPQTKRLGIDALRWGRNPPVGELLRGRMTVMGKDPVGDDKGVVIAQHDLLDEAGRLVFSCLTRSVFSR
jgi:hypothetical protein